MHKKIQMTSEAEEPNVATNTDKKADPQQVPQKETQPELSEDDIVHLIESIDP